MTAKLIKGTEIREEILKEIADEVKEIKEKHGAVPGLVTILVGENPASISYVTTMTPFRGFWFSSRYQNIWMKKRCSMPSTRTRMLMDSTR
jgi:ABC-type Fe3+-hydroxamate transport system substrate-binding protein